MLGVTGQKRLKYLLKCVNFTLFGGGGIANLGIAVLITVNWRSLSNVLPKRGGVTEVSLFARNRYLYVNIRKPFYCQYQQRKSWRNREFVALLRYVRVNAQRSWLHEALFVLGYWIPVKVVGIQKWFQEKLVSSNSLCPSLLIANIYGSFAVWVICY